MKTSKFLFSAIFGKFFDVFVIKRLPEVNLDLQSQNATFFSKRFLTKILIFLQKNSIFQSAKQFCEVDLDSWGQNTTFFF
jgi:hypothetical protein